MWKMCLNLATNRTKSLKPRWSSCCCRVDDVMLWLRVKRLLGMFRPSRHKPSGNVPEAAGSSGVSSCCCCCGGAQHVPVSGVFVCLGCSRALYLLWAFGMNTFHTSKPHRGIHASAPSNNTPSAAPPQVNNEESSRSRPVTRITSTYPSVKNHGCFSLLQ